MPGRGGGNRPFGFFKVKVKAPEGIFMPILQTRLQTKSGWRTVSPVGEWTGVYLSEEIYNAMKYGYTFEVIEGYIYSRVPLPNRRVSLRNL